MTNYSKLHLWMTAFLLVCVSQISAQDLSERESVALFELSGLERADLSADISSGTDRAIRQVFIDTGRFHVVGESYRLESASVEAFVAALRDYHDDSEPPADDRADDPADRADDPADPAPGLEILPSLADIEYLVVPVLVDYSEETSRSAGYQAEVHVEFSFIDSLATRIFERFRITATGSGEGSEAAIAAALEDVPRQLEERLVLVPEFAAVTGIIDLIGRQVLVDMGSDMGLDVGDEFTINETESGLIFLSEVRGEYSFGYTIYADPEPQIGDQLREKWSLPLDIELYGGMQGMSIPDEEARIPEMVPTAGILLTGSRGFFPVRPLLRVEFPFLFTNSAYQDTPQGDYYGVAVALGGEYLAVLGRARVAPFALLGAIGGRFAEEATGDELEESSLLSHIGVSSGLRLGWHLSRHLVVSLTPGVSAYVGINGLASLVGPSLTLGVNVK